MGTVGVQCRGWVWRFKIVIKIEGGFTKAW